MVLSWKFLQYDIKKIEEGKSFFILSKPIKEHVASQLSTIYPSAAWFLSRVLSYLRSIDWKHVMISVNKPPIAYQIGSFNSTSSVLPSDINMQQCSIIYLTVSHPVFDHAMTLRTVPDGLLPS
jgi:hypothetical protein